MSESDTRKRTIRSVEEIDTVVDCDFHVRESMEDIKRYIQDPYGKLIKNPSRGVYPWPGFVMPSTVGNIDREDMPITNSSEGVRDAMDLLSVDHPILTPSLNLYLSCVQHDDLAAAMANAYNSWLLDEILDDVEGAKGAILVGPRKPAKAAEEIDDRANESDMKAVMVPNGGTPLLLGNEKYWPIYEAAEDNGLPIVMHAASGNAMFSLSHAFQSFNRFLSTHVVAHSEMHMNNMADMITRGVPVEFPDLNFIFQEAGLGYIPYFMRRFDHEYYSKKYDAPMLDKKPSEYINDQFYFTSQPIEGTDEPGYVNDIARLFNADQNLLFSSDYPHFDYDESDELLTSLYDFSDEEVNNIYGQTAMELYNL